MALSPHVGRTLATSIARVALDPSKRVDGRHPLDWSYVESVSRGLEVFCPDPSTRAQCMRAVEAIVHDGARGADAGGGERTDATPGAVEIPVRTEQDILNARCTARMFSSRAGFDEIDQAKITTTISELARNIHRYAQSGVIHITSVASPRHGVRIVARDEGPGIPHLERVLAGLYESKTGLGLGILGCKRLMDEFAIESVVGRGTCVTVTKYLRGAA